MPEDLVIYISQNTKDPDNRNHDRLVDYKTISKLNEKGKHFINFGDIKTRAASKYPDYVYMTIIALDKPTVMYL
jgi:hypothetical protein